MRPWAAHVRSTPTVISRTTPSSAAATTTVSAAASPNTTSVRRGMASVCLRPNAMPSPAIRPPVWSAPTASAVCQGGHLPQMAAMGKVRAAATEESTADARGRVSMEGDQVS